MTHLSKLDWVEFLTNQAAAEHQKLRFRAVAISYVLLAAAAAASFVLDRSERLIQFSPETWAGAVLQTLFLVAMLSLWLAFRAGASEGNRWRFLESRFIQENVEFGPIVLLHVLVGFIIFFVLISRPAVQIGPFPNLAYAYVGTEVFVLIANLLVTELGSEAFKDSLSRIRNRTRPYFPGRLGRMLEWATRTAWRAFSWLRKNVLAPLASLLLILFFATLLAAAALVMLFVRVETSVAMTWVSLELGLLTLIGLIYAFFALIQKQGASNYDEILDLRRRLVQGAMLPEAVEEEFYAILEGGGGPGQEQSE